MSPDAYLVPARDGRAETEVRRSRFLATVRRVEDEAAARSLVEELRRTHPDARHHCSALALGPWGAGSSVQRASDDGEPSGTAGAPMLEVLRGREVADVVVVVSRWFGGVLLGAGGLVRAYGDATRAGLDAVGVRRRERRDLLDVEVGHADAGRLESDLRSRGVVVLDTTYAATVTLRVAVAPARTADLVASVAALSAGTASTAPAGSSWVDVEDPQGSSTPST
ncbi:YigZ family protein [Nocardioides zeae]|uniref:YigZ family protein n=1 Tax=Nocardioides imazamoxiresistens TaxID=3231893 RepID=A0ABU3PYM6_9ACTN|nr:YigZ family protein [Nocardioides zeae]MDT9594341.1 YigZ family protein [Nocardioides zeae]